MLCMETYFHCDGIPSERVGSIPQSGIRARAVPETSFSTVSRKHSETEWGIKYDIIRTLWQKITSHRWMR